MINRIYFVTVLVLFTVGTVIVVGSLIVITHDQLYYQQLSASYREAIEKLQDDFHFAGLQEDEQVAIRDQHQCWVDDEKIEWWYAHDPFKHDGQEFVTDSEKKKSEALQNFRRAVPRWGIPLFQQNPVAGIAVSFLAFIPAVLLVLLTELSYWVHQDHDKSDRARFTKDQQPQWRSAKLRRVELRATYFVGIAGLALWGLVLVNAIASAR